MLQQSDKYAKAKIFVKCVIFRNPRTPAVSRPCQNAVRLTSKYFLYMLYKTHNTQICYIPNVARIWGGRRKRSNRRSYGLNRYNKYGGDLITPIVYTQEIIKKQIEEYKKNISCFSSYAPIERKGEYGLDNIKTKDHTFYTNNLCVFVEFDSRITYNVTCMYLGEMTSSAEDLAKFVDNAKRRDSKLSFQCDLLYSHGNDSVSFSKEFKFNGLPMYRVLIGFRSK